MKLYGYMRRSWPFLMIIKSNKIDEGEIKLTRHYMKMLFISGKETKYGKKDGHDRNYRNIYLIQKKNLFCYSQIKLE